MWWALSADKCVSVPTATLELSNQHFPAVPAHRSLRSDGAINLKGSLKYRQDVIGVKKHVDHICSFFATPARILINHAHATFQSFDVKLFPWIQWVRSNPIFLYANAKNQTCTVGSGGASGPSGLIIFLIQVILSSPFPGWWKRQRGVMHISFRGEDCLLHNVLWNLNLSPV